MKTKILFMLFLFLFVLSGCDLFNHNNTDVPDLKIQEDIKSAQNAVEKSSIIIKKSSDEITKEAISIKKEADKTSNALPLKEREKVDPHLSSIKESSDAIIEDTYDINKATAELSSVNSLLNNAEEKIIAVESTLKKVETERDTAIEERDKALIDKNSQMQKMLQWLVIACIVGAGLCVVAFFMFGSKMGIVGAGACVLVLTLASFVQAYFAYLAIAGGLILLALLGVLIWSVILQKKAFSQVVDTVEVTKNGLSPAKKEELFGKDGEIGLMNKIQSPSTINLVKKEKAKMTVWNSIKKINGD